VRLLVPATPLRRRERAGAVIALELELGVHLRRLLLRSRWRHARRRWALPLRYLGALVADGQRLQRGVGGGRGGVGARAG
jgi:hypothetical protein